LVEDEGLLKDFVVIFVFLGVLCAVCCFFFNARVLFAKKKMRCKCNRIEIQINRTWGHGKSPGSKCRTAMIRIDLKCDD
jgi:hypothetical protein